MRVDLLDATLGTGFTLMETLLPRATRTIDVGALRAYDHAPGPGVAVVTATAAGSPVVSRALAGSFTVANLATLSTWGAPAAARSAW